MKITQVRNATLIVEFGRKRFLVDPMLAPKGAYPGFEGTPNNHLRNPLVELKTPMEEIVRVDAAIVTHTHPDHWDEVAVATVPKELPLFVQNESDAELIRSQGFADIRLLSEHSHFDGVALIKTPGQHGSDQAITAMPFLGAVCGVVFRHPDEKVLYLTGDTIWNEHVKQVLSTYAPQVIVVNAGDAQVPGLGSIIMNADDVLKVYRAAPKATVLSSHMEAVNHCLLSRSDLRAFAQRNSMTDRLLVPEDGETQSL